MICLSKRFWLVWGVTVIYASIIPAAILLRMGSEGWHWIWNDLAFSFFMVGIFPFAAAAFSCVLNGELLRKLIQFPSKQFGLLVIFIVMLVVVALGVIADGRDPHRAHRPYMMKDTSQVVRIAMLHDEAFKSNDISVEFKRYLDAANNIGNELSKRMVWLFAVCNFINVGFAVTVFCYILLAAFEDNIDGRTCNHLVFTITVMAIWFPCRAYADWYINLTDVTWLKSYAAAWALLFLLVAAAFVLAVKMVGGTLYHSFAIPAGAITAIATALAAFKPKLLSQVALAISGFQPIFLAAFALIIISVVFYISTLVHQYKSPTGNIPEQAPAVTPP